MKFEHIWTSELFWSKKLAQKLSTEIILPNGTVLKVEK